MGPLGEGFGLIWDGIGWCLQDLIRGRVKYACLCSFIYIDNIKMALNFNDMNYNLIV